MSIESKIITEISDTICKHVCRKTMRLMMSNHHKLSGDDSCLKNTWDEFCVQVQYEDSFFVDSYITTLNAYIKEAIESLSKTEKQAIWLQTEGGLDWLFNNGDKEDEPVPDENEIIDHIRNNYMVPEAMNYSNKRIEYYKMESHE